MKLSSVSGISYLVKDIAKTAEFYESLGFRIGKQDAGKLTCYVNWYSVEFIAQDKTAKPEQKQDAEKLNGGAGVYLQLKVENADEFYEGVVAKGMKPDAAPEGKKTTGRSFVLRDPDGYRLVFFEKK
jgi:catechol 2,3-dioxygenase-like lactoylglutathione lyase family enzyme